MVDRIYYYLFLPLEFLFFILFHVKELKLWAYFHY